MTNALPLYSAAQVGQFDARAIRDFDIPGYTLMQRAAAAAYAEMKRRWPDARRLLVLAGPGNNGGDAVELGRQALADGREVMLFLLADPDRLKGEAAEAWAAARAAGLEARALDGLDAGLVQADVVVDGLLGTGLSRPVAEPIAGVIRRANAARRPLLALDLPSGLAADSGAVLGCAIEADVTVSFIGRKQGLYTGAARDHCGEMVFADLAVPAGVFERSPPEGWLMSPRDLKAALPPRRHDSHKGRNGHVLAVGGGPGFSGAIRLCGAAALRGGAGLVSVLTHPDNAVVVSQAQPELMVRGLAADDPQVQALLERASVLAVGPGLGLLDWSASLLAAALAAGKPLVLDADALNLLDGRRRLPPDTVLTPHPGEAGRMLGLDTAEVQRDRLQAASRLAQQTGAVVVLKGAGSIVADTAGARWVCPAGNPGMAAGGMGDLLTGLIAALRAQGLEAAEAACHGVLIHALAGDAAARDGGQRGLLPSDLLPQLRAWLNP